MKTAIALSGGGAKGAYELGAWEALEEMNISYDIVTGTSIGSINGALMVQRDLEGAQQLWENISLEQLVSGILLENDNEGAPMKTADALLPFVKTAIYNKGIDITPMKQMMEKYLHEDSFFSSPVDFGMMTVRFPSLSPIEMVKERMNPQNFRQWILASASCFPAFPPCAIGGQSYIDGGYYDNLPIDTAFRLGADRVIAIDLHPEAVHPEYEHHPCVVTIKPNSLLGSMLVPDKNVVARNRRMGYLDTMKAFGRYDGNRYTFFSQRREEDDRFSAAVTRLQLRSMKDATVLSKFSANHPLNDALSFHGDFSTPKGCRIAAQEILCEEMNLSQKEIYSTDQLVEFASLQLSGQKWFRDMERILTGDVSKHLLAAEPKRVLCALFCEIYGK